MGGSNWQRHVWRVLLVQGGGSCFVVDGDGGGGGDGDDNVAEEEAVAVAVLLIEIVVGVCVCQTVCVGGYLVVVVERSGHRHDGAVDTWLQHTPGSAMLLCPPQYHTSP